MAAIGSFGSHFSLTIIATLFVLTIIVFFHEFGHFIVARLCGVRVVSFSLGFGPELVGRNDRTGTRWKLSAIPLGGYVKFAGDENAASVPDQAALAELTEEERRTSFFFKPLWQRAAIVAAGPLANFVLSIAIFALIFMVNGRPMAEARISAVEPSSPAAAAGFEPGDLITAIDGQHIRSFSEVQRTVSGAAGETLSFTVQRDGKPVTLTAVPERRTLKDRFGNDYSTAVLGIQREQTAANLPRERLGPVRAVAAGASETWFVVDRTAQVLAGIVTGRESASELGGPIRVAEVSGEVATLGVLALLGLAAMLSVSIGLINLVPIPMLDGGHLFYYAIEAIRGRPLSERAQEIGFRIGLALVLMLMIFATFNDIVRLVS